MAGSWLKMRHDLIDAPEIRRLSRACSVTRDDVYGKLFRLWSWFDRHSHNGRVAEETGELVDEIVGLSGFAQALVSVGWLAEDHGGIVIPNWDRHNSETAKQRALAAERQEKYREKQQCNAAVTQGASLDETRRELPPLPREGFDQKAWQSLRKAWNAGPGKPWRLVNPPANLPERLADATWAEAAPQAIERLSRCRYFRTPVSLRQFCGIDDQGVTFVEKIVAGDFDDPPSRATAGRDFADATPPPRVWSGEADAARKAMLAKLDKLKEEAS